MIIHLDSEYPLIRVLYFMLGPDKWYPVMQVNHISGIH